MWHSPVVIGLALGTLISLGVTALVHSMFWLGGLYN